jgi:hypothetical protein
MSASFDRPVTKTPALPLGEYITQVEEPAAPVYATSPTSVGSGGDLMSYSPRTPDETRVRYTATEAGLVTRPAKAATDIRHYEVRPKHDQIPALVSKCHDLVDGMLETNDIIERENLYRTLDVALGQLFELRTSSDRPFGHLLVLLLAVTKHTTSEFFTTAQLSALKHAIGIIKKSRIVDSDLREARQILSRADFDPYRPFRGAFEDV